MSAFAVALSALFADPNIGRDAVYIADGGAPVLVRVVARDEKDLYRVSEEIRLCPGVVRTRTSLYLRTLIDYRLDQLVRRPHR